MVLPQKFYERGATKVAKELLGAFLVTNLPEGKTVGRVMETEAYLSSGDPASHSFKGKTKRNSVMFGPPGHAYVYFIYGMYYCVNVVTGREGAGEAVLIRALEPIEGRDIMGERRGVTNIHKLCNGPGKLTKALGITKWLNGASLLGPEAYILSPDSYPKFKAPKDNEIKVSARIGISKGTEHLLRFYI